MPQRTQPTPISRSLADRLERALRKGGDALDALDGAEPLDDRDRLLALHTIHDLHLGDLDRVGPAVRWQHHPAVAGLKCRLEAEVLADLDSEVEPDVEAVAALRAIARDDQIPAVYDWLATEATWDELVGFLALEGGPDAGFDDLVAICQVGLRGEPKLELARNYWDEMGRGTLAEIHTELHHDLTEAIGMPVVPRREQPTSGLLRTVLGGILATNRALQPEMVGALGLLELQAGPRCRRVVQALERLDAPAGAFPFYVEHEQVDPHHGKAWLDNAVTHLAEDPFWAEGIVRGARWRAQVNRAFFAEMAERFCAPAADELSSRSA